jgi:uncharacterized protein YndB with AHSA1/START domain
MIAEQATGIAVRKTVVVEAPAERAFSVFTEGITMWWPLETHHIGKVPATAALIEPRAGGRCCERGVDGSESLWGHVLVWEPPHRFVFSWELSCDWAHDPGIASQVEVTFTPEGDNTTRVELEHRGLETYGDRSGEMRDIFDSGGGWTGLLERFRRAAEG